MRTTQATKGIVLSLLLGASVILLCGTAAWASTRFGEDIEVQAWFRVRNSFQADGRDHFDWVQWRNEAFIYVIHNGLVKNGQVLNTSIHIPFIEGAQASVRYRARVDPVYYLRDHYRRLYDADHRTDWFNPERDFRDAYLDLEHGEIGPGRLSSRWGYQQIVWGESDLYRSLDIINPLRIDQGLPIGEKFDEFRFPLLATKFLYDIGVVGDWFSGVGIEAFFTPRWFGGSKNLLITNGWRIQPQERGCLPPGGTKLLDYSPANCGKAGTKFLPFRPYWVGQRRFNHPWEFNVDGPNARINAVDYACLTQRCAPDVPGDRLSVLVNLPKGNFHHHQRGTNLVQNMATGARLIGSTRFGLDFSLNYIYIPVEFANTNPVGSAPLLTYGDGIPGAAGTFQEGLERCLSPTGKGDVGRNGQTNGPAVQLVGTDLHGYDWPDRRLDAKGAPLSTAKQKQAARPAVTICTNGFNHQHNFTHVIGLTGTYNDYEYTGAVLRFEQSLSTREKVNKKVIGYANNFNPTPEVVANAAQRNGRILVSTPVWRSMLGFDLISALGNYPGMHWAHNLPGHMGTDQSFLSFQWLMQYNFEGFTNNMCNWNFAQGIGASTPADGAPVRKAIRGCTTKRWNNFFTLGLGGYGFFGGRLEQRLAVAFEPGGKQWLLYGQWWWHNFLTLPVDLSGGVAWFPGSRMDNSWTQLNYFANRNLLWLEATYYVL